MLARAREDSRERGPVSSSVACFRRREGAEALPDCRQSRPEEEVLSVGRTKVSRIVRVHGGDEKFEEATKRFDTHTEASVRPCFLVGNDIVL